jgi:NAD(P)H-flavin reductase
MPWNLYDNKRLHELARKPWFDYTPVVSEDRAYPGARGLVGTVAARYGDWSRRTVLVCGPPPMVLHTVGELKAWGVPASNIRREQFDFAATPQSSESTTWEAR